jgi:hypothetical protein
MTAAANAAAADHFISAEKFIVLNLALPAAPENC